ncbi:phosphodiesterase [Stutzerimonas stutzeri]|uniref:phosphodiesterase n=1 Tax=Stutzerimonas stutzeri TaxID=316 RepID=UPI0015E27A2D|nr:phosphodiesterase [Stutzerimonas stutzeri]MBA1261765.1 phosphodiesterase [Stutzerimonas stutzeri]
MRPLLLPFLVFALSLPAHADIIRIPVGQQGTSYIALPTRGESKIQVLDRFGLADEEHPAVGQPPITRWDYRTFSVYFEGNRVINSVLHHQRASPLEREAQP